MLRNLAAMTTATTGIGTITLGSAVSSYLTFALAGVANGENVAYAIVDGTAREIGRGIYTTSGPTLTRTVLKSTNSDTAISLSGTAQVFITPPAEAFTRAVGITIDGGGAVISTGVKGYVAVPYNGIITRATMLADVAGAAVVDIWKDVYASYPPVVGDSITASAKPTITATNISSQDTTLTGWTTLITNGDVMGFNVDSCATITRLHVILRVEPI